MPVTALHTHTNTSLYYYCVTDINIGITNIHFQPMPTEWNCEQLVYICVLNTASCRRWHEEAGGAGRRGSWRCWS